MNDPSLSSLSPTVTTGRWADISDRAYREAIAAEAKLEAAHVNIRPLMYAALAQYAGMKFGWQSPEFKARWNKVLSRRLPSRGWGIGEAWGERTAGTTYSITTAWHVGSLLLAGYDGGGIPGSYLYDAADALMDFPRVPGSKCIAYSSSGYDQTHTGCVYNIEAASSWFLWEVMNRGLIGGDDVLAMVRAWRDDVAGHFNPNTKIWPYSNISVTPQETWHNGPVVFAMLKMRPDKGEPGLIGQFDTWGASGGNTLLLPLACDRRDSQYEAIRASAQQGCTVAADCNSETKRQMHTLGTRSAYVVSGLQIQQVCGD